MFIALRKLFDKEVQEALFGQKYEQKVLEVDAFNSLPAAVQDYFSRGGFLGKPLVSNVFILYDHAQIKLRPHGRWMNLKCTQFNSLTPATRVVLMQASMYGFVPFGARDIYQQGQGNMLIKLAGFTISNARGAKMNQSSLVTFLAEAPLLPSILLQQNVTLQEVSPDLIKAIITDAGITVGGEFRFNSRNEITSFTNQDRFYSTNGKTYVNWEWSALLDRYKVVNGFKVPTVVRAVWHMNDGRDYEYFRASIKSIKL